MTTKAKHALGTTLDVVSWLSLCTLVLSLLGLFD